MGKWSIGLVVCWLPMSSGCMAWSDPSSESPPFRATLAWGPAPAAVPLDAFSQPPEEGPRSLSIGPTFIDERRAARPAGMWVPPPNAAKSGLLDGRLALVQSASREGHVAVYEAHSGQEVPTGPMPRWLGPSLPHVSADGRRLVFVTDGPVGGRLVLWDLDAAREVHLAGLEREGRRDPDLSADGRWLISLAGPAQDLSLRLYDQVSGSEVALPAMAKPPSGARTPTLSGDGLTAAYVAASARGDTNIFLLDLREGRPLSPPQLNSADQERDPALSSDGRLLLFSSDRNGTFDLFAYDLWQDRYMDVQAFNSLADETQPRFLGPRDGGVSYVSNREGPAVAFMRPFDGWR